MQLNAQGYGLNEEGRTYVKKQLQNPNTNYDWLRSWIRNNVVGGNHWDRGKNRDFVIWLAEMGYPQTSDCLMKSDIYK